MLQSREKSGNYKNATNFLDTLEQELQETDKKCSQNPLITKLEMGFLLLSRVLKIHCEAFNLFFVIAEAFPCCEGNMR